MIFLNLFLTSLFAFSNFTSNNAFFERKAEQNYLRYLRSHNIVEYNEGFVGNLYNNDYIIDETMITVLTHGMCGNKDYWFPKNPDDNFESCMYMDLDSLPYKIINQNPFSMENIPILTVKPCFDENPFSNYSFDSIIVNQLKCINQNSFYRFEDISFNSIEENKELFKHHIVLLYDLDNIDFEKNHQSNFYYSEIFKFTLDSFLAQTSIFYGGKLPKINLIGHSRGGIANLYYAESREKLIDNIISIATPYNGSITAELIDIINGIGIECGFIEDEGNFYDGLYSEENIFQCPLILSRLNSPYKIAIGCETSPTRFLTDLYNVSRYLFQQNDDEILNNNNNNNRNNIFSDIFDYIYNAFNGNNLASLELIDTLMINIKNILIASRPVISEGNIFHEIFRLIGGIINPDYLSAIDCQKILQLLSNFINKGITFCDSILNFDNINCCIKSDICVELDSQFCSNQNNQNYFDEKIMIPIGYGNFEIVIDKYLSNINLPAVTHNYESAFPEIGDIIVGKLISRNSIHSHTFSNSVCVCGFNNNYIEFNKGQIPFYYLSDFEIENIFAGDLRISGDEFGFRENYYFEEQILEERSYLYSFLNTDVIDIQTTRLRTGFIRNESITLSPNRQGAGFAFIEFVFSQPIYCMSFDLSLWSSDESINTSNLTFGYTQNEIIHDFIFGNSYLNNEYQTLTTITSRGKFSLMSNDSNFQYVFDKINPNEMSVDRNHPEKIRIYNDDGFTYIGFYAACDVTSSSKNKGRICIKNFAYYLYE